MVETVLFGFGNVGRELVREIIGFGRDVELKIVFSSKGYVVVKSGTVLRELVELAEKGARLDQHSRFRYSNDPFSVIDGVGAELAFIAIPPSYESGEPNRTIYYGLIERGVSIITADKTLLAREYREIMDSVRRKNLFLGIRATVSAGTPVTDVARGLRGRRVERIRAVLNATTNYILSLIENGLSYDEALRKAIKEKFAEPDPRVDTHGWDPASKLTIIASILGFEISVFKVKRVPLESVDQGSVREALSMGYRVKYLAEADLVSGEYVVHPVRIPSGEYLASVTGIYNAVEFQLENERIVVKGPAGPAWRTAKTMITDLIEYLDVKGFS